VVRGTFIGHVEIRHNPYLKGSMTSGSFTSLSISSIVVNRAERQRKELLTSDILADSIRRLGLIHPVVVRRDDCSLVAGERRLEACRSLGLDSY
jgi:ParB-like chromosome segregation protein Spo0J